MKTKRSFGYALLASVTLLGALQGCGDDDNGGNDKPPVVNPKGGSGGSGNEAGSPEQNGGSGTTGGKNGNGGKGGTGNTGNTGGDDNVGGSGEGGAPPTPACDLPELGEDGCYNCPKKGETEQWLNRCVDSDCEPFDNDRVELLNADGSLPPLPT
jgi:hypothetical protein